MALAEMRRVEVLAPHAQTEHILALLQRLGTVEISDHSAETKELAEAGILLGNESPAAQTYAELLGKLQGLLDFLGRYAEQRRPFIEQFTGSKFGVTPEEFAAIGAEKQALEALFTTCTQLDARLTQLQHQISEKKEAAVQLSPWVGLDLPLEDLRDTKWLHLVAAELPGGEAAWAQLAEKITELDTPLYLERVSPEGVRGPIRFFLMLSRSKASGAHTLLAEVGAVVIEFPAGTGTAAARRAALQQELIKLHEEQEQLEKQAAALAAQLPKVRLLYDYVTQEYEREQQRTRLLATQSVFLLSGWIKAADVPQLKREMSRFAPAAYLLVRAPQPGEEPPVALENTRGFRPFQSILELYSTPQNGELDPTPWVAIFFTIFFGIMLTDAAYGIILAITAVWFLKRIRMEETGTKLFVVLFWGGLSSLVMGALAGSWFGDLPIRPLWFNPLTDPIKMLVVSFALGLLHIFVGIGLEFYENVRKGAVWTAIFDQGFWFVFILGLVLLLAAGASPIATVGTVAKALTILGVIGLVLTQGRHHQNLFMKLGSGILSLYNITGYFSDVLSYSRLLALGLATGVIASVINILARMALALPYVGYLLCAVVFVGGHLFNLIINVMGTYVHTSRLQYVEFFGKFFEGGGKLFDPFRIRTKYTFFRTPPKQVGNQN